MPSHDPTLDALMSDPLVIAMMKADRVNPVRLRAKFKRIGAELERRRGDRRSLRRIRDYLHLRTGPGPAGPHAGGIW